MTYCLPLQILQNQCTNAGETPKSVRRFDGTKIEDLKREIISETETTVDMYVRNELAAFKKKCKKLVAMSCGNRKICVENLENKITRKSASLINFY